MIPYFQFTTIPLGPLRLQVWGLFVSLGIVLATFVGRRECRRRNLDPDRFTDFATWILVGAFIGARLFYVFAYAPLRFIDDPLAVFRIWEGGLSSFGGFIGAGVAAMIAARALHIRFGEYADVAAFVLPLGYGCGRIGCFLIHDHPGTLSQSFLAVQYPGGARLDHGLLLSIVGFAMFGLFFVLNRYSAKDGDTPAVSGPRLKPGWEKKKGLSPFAGIFLPALMILYGVARFVLDFFRAHDLPGADGRYYGLTVAQYGCLALVLGGSAILMARRRIVVTSGKTM